MIDTLSKERDKKETRLRKLININPMYIEEECGSYAKYCEEVGYLRGYLEAIDLAENLESNRITENYNKSCKGVADILVEAFTNRPQRVCSTCRHKDVDEYGYANCGRKPNTSIVNCSEWLEDF
ncbi:MAG: hypothetical protein ACRCX7_12605 [Cetobacterium sp.]|uniref:hypothetical protein n=1 Tax=Cetobacterium sp. TaxID=2071632 RepID=UPI003F3A5606